mgnify:FL=1
MADQTAASSRQPYLGLDCDGRAGSTTRPHGSSPGQGAEPEAVGGGHEFHEFSRRGRVGHSELGTGWRIPGNSCHSCRTGLRIPSPGWFERKTTVARRWPQGSPLRSRRQDHGDLRESSEEPQGNLRESSGKPQRDLRECSEGRSKGRALSYRQNEPFWLVPAVKRSLGVRSKRLGGGPPLPGMGGLFADFRGWAACYRIGLPSVVARTSPGDWPVPARCSLGPRSDLVRSSRPAETGGWAESWGRIRDPGRLGEAALP